MHAAVPAPARRVRVVAVQEGPDARPQTGELRLQASDAPAEGADGRVGALLVVGPRRAFPERRVAVRRPSGVIARTAEAT